MLRLAGFHAVAGFLDPAGTNGPQRDSAPGTTIRRQRNVALRSQPELLKHERIGASGEDPAAQLSQRKRRPLRDLGFGMIDGRLYALVPARQSRIEVDVHLGVHARALAMISSL